MTKTSVATALTVYGIETLLVKMKLVIEWLWLQQPLPFTVLKLSIEADDLCTRFMSVATALTVYGIETSISALSAGTHLMVATALTVYGIETVFCTKQKFFASIVATALTVYGIETIQI